MLNFAGFGSVRKTSKYKKLSLVRNYSKALTPRQTSNCCTKNLNVAMVKVHKVIKPIETPFFHLPCLIEYNNFMK